MDVGVHPFSRCFSGTKRQTTLPFKPIKKMKRNPWSDSESDSESDDFEVPSKRERVVRQAAGEWWHRMAHGGKWSRAVQRDPRVDQKAVLKAYLFYCM